MLPIPEVDLAAKVQQCRELKRYSAEQWNEAETNADYRSLMFVSGDEVYLAC